MEQNLQRKEPFVAGLLSFFITGAGQMYCGSVGKGIGLMIGAIIGWFLFVIPGLAIWIYGIVDAYNMAQQLNEQIDQQQRAHQDLMKKEKLENERRQEEEEKNKVKAKDFVDSIKKLDKLFKNELIDNDDHQKRKDKLISELSYKPIDMNPDDFLFELVSLKEQKILTNEEINTIKKYIFN
ncbi:MAG: hypothetical protein ACM34K_19470 [Bacillota bacterium]